MKKTILKGFAVAIALMASVNATAQINLDNLGNVLSSAVGSNLTSILTGKNNVTAENLTGTWSYQQPAIIFESSNLLKQAGGKIASAALEKKLATQFTKMGITPGKFMVTFGNDGTFSTVKDGTVTSSGTYTISGSKITFSYLQGTANVSGYAQLSDGAISLTFDSSKILGLVSTIAAKSSNSTLGTISSLAGSFDGMKTGLAFGKYTAPAVTTTKATTSDKKTTTAKKTTKKKSSKKRK